MNNDKVAVFGQHDQKTLDQFEKSTRHEAFYRGAIMADGHLGYGFPVGGVIAYHEHINLNGVGVDIGCGVKAIKLDLKGSSISPEQWKKIADDIAKNIAFGVGRGPATPEDHEVFEDPWWKHQLISGLKDKARNQLSSVGSGNHWVDIWLDNDDNVWVGCHFGSRGVGFSIAKHFMELTGCKESIDAEPVILSTKSQIGQDYLEAMHLAGRFAHAGRDLVCKYLAEKILKADVTEEVHQHHNFAWLENNDGNDVWVIRKGATPAFPGQYGAVGSSMGGSSAIVYGLGGNTELTRQTLFSTVHGSGRIMTRTAAAGKTKWLRGEDGKKRPTRVTAGLIDEAEMRSKIAAKGIELRGAGADEAPQVYRDLNQVLNYHTGTVSVYRWLYPKVVVMAGSDTFDPYKD